MFRRFTPPRVGPGPPAEGLPEPRPPAARPSYTYQTRPLQTDGVTLAVLGVAALIALRGYLWVQDGEILKASLLGAGSALGLAGWAGGAGSRPGAGSTTR